MYSIVANVIVLIGCHSDLVVCAEILVSLIFGVILDVRFAFMRGLYCPVRDPLFYV